MDLLSQVTNGMLAGAAAVLISNSDDSGFMRLQPDPVPAASLPLNSGLPLYAALASGQLLTIRFSLAQLPTGRLVYGARLHGSVLSEERWACKQLYVAMGSSSTCV